jgi:hypothetical protein
MTDIPNELLNVFADVEQLSISRWWDGLSEDARSEVARLCDERMDSCFFGVVADERDHVVPKVRGGRFVPDDDAWGFDEWGLSYFDHLIEHPELVLVWDERVRTFHTGCIRHPLAKACWSTGVVPENFECPFDGGSECLMRPLRGRKIRRLMTI